MHVARGQHVECAFLCQFWWKGDSQSGRHKGIKAAAKLLRETTRQLSMQNWKSKSRNRGRRRRWRWRWGWRSRAREEGAEVILSNCCSTGSAIVVLDFCSIKTLLLLYSSVNDGLPDRLPDWLTDRLTDWLRQRHNITASGDSKSKLRFVKADPGWKKRFVSPVSGPVLIFW